MLIAMPFEKTRLLKLIRTPLFILACISIGFLVVRTLFSILEIPEIKDQHIEDALKFGRLWLFLVIAFWINGSTKLALRVLFLAFIGFIVGMISSIDTDLLTTIIKGERTGFHLRITPFGLYSATIITGLIIFSKRLIANSFKRKMNFFILFGITIAIVLLLEGLIATQARGAWLAFALVFPVVVFSILKKSDLTHAHKQALSVAMALTICLFVFIIALNFEIIKNRFLGQIETFTQNREYIIEKVPETGIGQRLHLYSFAIQKWREHPIFGWGTGTTQYLISHSQREDLKINSWKGGRVWFDHLHSTYLEFLVRFGLIGTGLLFASIFILLKEVINAYKKGALPFDIFLFTISSWAMAAIWCLFDFRLLHWDWRFYWMIISGVGTSFVLKKD
ncbi:O-antigen polymerase [Dissulfuribacter thermophilus]|uniref:O-antigen polymerase n=2 Tax=Dissulfuribacter thermophilus TaxID=1156395 RepID=A0A1B9F507_9BACT|nr:O-antigen polymerase [Dissulfuribacter thermophilus]